MMASIVIPSRGGAERLPVILEALAHQTHPEWEAIVVLDGDIDGSADVVARYAHLPLRCLTFPENRGRVAALNAGFAEARGDVFIRADDDFEPGPDHVAAHVALHASGECGVAGLPLNIAPDSAYMRAYGQDADERGRRESYAIAPQERWRVWGGNTSVRRSTYEALGGFDTRYVGYGWEDLDFGYRVHRSGIPIVVDPSVEVRHHMAAITTASRARRAYRSGQGRRIFEEIHGDGVTGTAAGTPPSAWNRAVGALSRHLTYRRTERLASTIDGALPMLPKPVARKAVALVVESAALAGFASDEQTSHDV